MRGKAQSKKAQNDEPASRKSLTDSSSDGGQDNDLPGKFPAGARMSLAAAFGRISLAELRKNMQG